MNEAEKNGWGFALKLALVLTPLLFVQGGGLLYWMGRFDQRVTNVENLAAANAAALVIHGRDDGHPGALAILKANAAKIDSLRDSIQGIDQRIQTQWREFNRRGQ